MCSSLSRSTFYTAVFSCLACGCSTSAPVLECLGYLWRSVYLTYTSHSWTAPKRRLLSWTVLSPHCILRIVSLAAVLLKTWPAVCTLKSALMWWSRAVSGVWPTSCVSLCHSSNQGVGSSYASPCIPLSCRKRRLCWPREPGKMCSRSPYLRVRTDHRPGFYWLSIVVQGISELPFRPFSKRFVRNGAKPGIYP